jgi:hypothetical protein
MQGRKSDFLMLQNCDKPAKGDNPTENIGPPGLLEVWRRVNNPAPYKNHLLRELKEQPARPI